MFLIYSVGIAFSLLLILILLAVRHEHKQWNNGYCIHCGTALRLIKRDPYGCRHWRCPNCFFDMWTSWTKVD